MYPVPPTETLVETKNCRHCGVSFPITDKDLEFYEKVSPVFQTPPNLPLSGEGQISPPDKGDKGDFRYLIPSPTLCPDCRQQRRLSFRNERKLYKRKCDLTGKDIISIFSPDKAFKVYEQSEWWSDKWNPMDYGRDFDFSRPFFKQFGELNNVVPKLSLIQRSSLNSDYANDIEKSKNCYLCFTSWESEDCLYCSNVFWSKNCVDGFWFSECENCYEGVSLNKCYGVYNSISCFDCTDSHYLTDCKGCKNCLFSIGLTNKEYYFLNESIGKGLFREYENKIKTDVNFLKDCRKKFSELTSKMPRIFSNQSNCENCEGDFLSDSANSQNVFDAHYIENCKYVFQGGPLYDTMDVSITGSNDRCGLVYEGLSAAGSNKSISTITVWNSHDVFYSDNCHNSSHLFACIGLRNKSYCIFNKQYTKEEYEKLVPKIIEHMRKTGEWGEFFPSSISPFGYNETVAMEYYPLSKDEIIPPTPLSKGGSDEGAGGFVHGSVFNWSDYEAPFPKVDKIIPASKLPDDIKDIPDDILNWAIECEVTKTRGGNPLFRITKQELEFYRKHNLPIPRRHPDQRHLDRMSLRNPRKLFERKCDKCGVEMMTTYAPLAEGNEAWKYSWGAPERPEVVYCENCYLKEVS